MTGKMIEITRPDGSKFGCYRAEPSGTPRGAIVVVQEIFGVNAHIRSVADKYAAEGLLALAPALYDRMEPGVELGYGPEDMKKGLHLRTMADWDGCLEDIQLSIDLANPAGVTGIVGYCWGGGLAYAAACDLSGLDYAVGYYGGGWPLQIDMDPKCPTMMHFATEDHAIPIATAEGYTDKPAVIVHIYEAEHGFNCDMRPQFNPEASKHAFERTLSLIAAMT